MGLNLASANHEEKLEMENRVFCQNTQKKTKTTIPRVSRSMKSFECACKIFICTKKRMRNKIRIKCANSIVCDATKLFSHISKAVKRLFEL